MNAQEGITESYENFGIYRTATAQLFSPRLACPSTPSRDGPPSPFALFSSEKIDHLRVSSPALSLAQVVGIVSDQWANLSEEAKTPYKERAEQERHRHDTLDAALALTQIGTPSFRSGPSTPIEPRKTTKRCLDIGTPDWQPPQASTQEAGSAEKICVEDISVGDVPTGPSLYDWSPMCARSPGEHFREGVGRTPNVNINAIPESFTPSSGGGFAECAAGADPSQAKRRSPNSNGLGEKTHALAHQKQGLPGGDNKGDRQVIKKGKKREPSKKYSTAAGAKNSMQSARLRRRAYKAGLKIASKMSKKDPDRPKRSRSSYIIFCNERRNSLKKTMPGATTMDTGRLLGETWRSLPEDEKQRYTQKAQEDRERYESELIAIAENPVASLAHRSLAASHVVEG